ncbi:hypothetical protein JMF89_16730 [Clostridiaceae bacterium UIB06]|nr:hypothetical protein [Clostridiaceae bacterium UIB06]
MKKIALFVAAVVISLGMVGKVFADTNIATLADQAGITPDNTILYPIDKALDDLKVSIASGDAKEAEALVAVAEERLGESEVMADKEKTDLSTQALNEYNSKMTEAEDKLDAAIAEASNSSTTDSAIKLDELQKLETTITNRQMKSIEVLKNIENKVPEKAKETLAQVIEMQTRKKEAIIAVAKERQAMLQDKNTVKEAEKKLEEAKKAGDAEAIKAAEATLTTAQAALSTQNEKLAQAVSTKKEAMKGGVGKLKKEAKKEKTNDSSPSTTNTASENTNTTTVTAPSQNTETTTSNAITSTDTNTVNTTDISKTTVKTETTTKNNTKPDRTVKEIKDNEVKATKEKASKENKGLEMKAEKEKSSEKENNSNH